MDRRIVALMLACISTLAFAFPITAAAPADIARFQLNDGMNGFKISASQIVISDDQGQKVVAFIGKVNIAQGKSLIRCDQAVMWIDIRELNANSKTSGDLYVEGNVQIAIDDKPRSGNAAILNFLTLGGVEFPKERVLERSLTNSQLLQRANLARQQTKTSEINDPQKRSQVIPRGPTPSSPPSPYIGVDIRTPSTPIAATNIQTLPPTPVIPADVRVPPPILSPTPNVKPVDVTTPALDVRMPPNQVTSPAAAQPPITSPSVVANYAPTNDILRTQATSPGATATPAPDPVPGQPGGGRFLEPPVLETPPIPLPTINTRRLKIANRSASVPTNIQALNLANGEQLYIITGGVKVLAISPQSENAAPGPNGSGEQIVDIEADQVLIWQKGGKEKDGTIKDAFGDSEGITQSADKQTELYMTGHVIMRFGSSTEARNPDGSLVEDKVMFADQVYYDVVKNKALALDSTLLMMRAGLRQPAQFKGKRIEVRSLQEYWSFDSQVSASVLPADPGLEVDIRRIKVTEEKNVVRRTIFGAPFIDRFTGEEDVGVYRHFTAVNSFVEMGGVPFMYFPYYAGNVESPFGPLQNVSFSENSIFGVQFYTTWSMLDLLGIKKLPGEQWSLFLDYLNNRGKGIGTSYDLTGNRLFGYDAPFTVHAVAYGINDKGADALGGPRDAEFIPVNWRERFLYRYTQTYEDWSFQGQLAWLSDHNFLEQYYNYEWNYGPNQETFIYPKYQSGNGAATFLAEPNFDRPWVTESQWLPKLDGQWLGQSFFDTLTYNAWGGIGYSKLQTYNLPPSQLPSITGVNWPANPSENPINTMRADFMQQVSVPFTVGPMRLNPYGMFDMTYYSQDYNNSNQGRLYGGGGVRASMPLSRLYDDVESDLFNVQGLFHKMTFKGNYYNAGSNTPASVLPQLDRLNDDATMQSVRDITPWQPVYNNSPTGYALYNSPVYDPRQYAIRRLVDTRVDTLGTIQEFQAEVDQRFQTKRGYPGMEHTIDYITFNMSATMYPAANRDDFGHPISFVEYYGAWAVGDRNGFTSTGWFDPWAFGTKYWNVSSYYNRPDGTNFTLNYLQYDPVGSRLVSGSVAYNFSPKYAVSFSAGYDLAITTNQSTSLNIIRTGTDLTWMVGFSYNAILNNFGFNFMVLPNLVLQRSGSTGGVVPNSGTFGTTTMTNGRQ